MVTQRGRLFQAYVYDPALKAKRYVGSFLTRDEAEAAVDEQRVSNTLEDRFWRKVFRSDGCWEWLGTRREDGYGLLRVGRVMQRAHRVSWEIHNGLIPDGLHVLHRCDNPPCVNPAHLFLGTHQDNMADKVAKGRHKLGAQQVGMRVVVAASRPSAMHGDGREAQR